MIEDDSVFEETESLMVSLSLTGAPDGVQLSQQTAAIVITNDDGMHMHVHTIICSFMYIRISIQDCMADYISKYINHFYSFVVLHRIVQAGASPHMWL